MKGMLTSFIILVVKQRVPDIKALLTVLAVKTTAWQIIENWHLTKSVAPKGQMVQ